MLDTDRLAESPAPPETLEQKVARLEAENEELKIRLASAETKATFDKLTGLPNEEVIEMSLEAELAEVRRGHQKLLVIYLDLDHFKQVNDTWGHERGDQILKQFAHEARARLRVGDKMGRLHGEEFAILARLDLEYSLDDIKKIIEKINLAANAVNRSPNEEKLPQTISIGGVVVDSNSTLSVREVLKAADENVYLSKKHGRNQATVSVAGKEGREVIEP